jgi:hypothetical protein
MGDVRSLDTDYLVVGAGAAGMAFTDELLRHSDATVTIVDRRHAPGGHWLEAYPFVRLHQPSTFYGVTSAPLGQDALDATGANAGFYELASASEIRAYYERVMNRCFLPTDRVRYFPNSDFVGEHRFVSRLSGAEFRVEVRRRLVDTTYLEGEFPSTSPPPFEVADGVRCMPAGEVSNLTEAPARYVIIGAGKTALDVCVWLLERGAAASSICWIKPREAWWLNRRFQQPHTLWPDYYRGVAVQVEAMAQATSVEDLFARLEQLGIVLRMDTGVSPDMFRGAVTSEAELELIRQIEDVVRLGHVKRITRDEIVLDRGRIPTNERTVHVHCAAHGLARPPLRPIFERGRVTVQPIHFGFACYQFATLGVVEATLDSDDEKNRLCPPIHYWDRTEDYLSAWLATLHGEYARARHAELGEWMTTTRLNPASGITAHRDDQRVSEARELIKINITAATTNLPKLAGARSQPGEAGATSGTETRAFAPG